jgi:hypothetical protein
MKTKQNKKAKKNETLFGRTDYAVKQVNFLILMGAIPEEFVAFRPDTGITIDYFITSFMEHFPRKELGDNWIDLFDNSIKHACHLVGYEISTSHYVQKFRNGEVSAAYADTTRLGRRLDMEKAKLDKLLHRGIQRNPDLQFLVMHVGEAGYMVSSFLLNQLERTGVRLDEYLKDMASGTVRFEVNRVS